MELLDLKVNKRETRGKGAARELRRRGHIPAVLYGAGIETVSLSVDVADLELVYKKSGSGQLLVNLDIPDMDAPMSAMVKELQTHPVSQNYLHADFYEVSMDRKIKVNVPVVATGKSIGVEMGGIMQLVRRELEMLCLPLEIPESIEIDITDLEIGDSVHVDDIPLEGDIEIIHDVNFTVLTVVAPKVEEEPEEEEDLEGEEGVEGEEGAEGEEGEAGEGAEPGKAEKGGE